MGLLQGVSLWAGVIGVAEDDSGAGGIAVRVAAAVLTASMGHRCGPAAGSNSIHGPWMLFPQHLWAIVAAGAGQAAASLGHRKRFGSFVQQAPAKLRPPPFQDQIKLGGIGLEQHPWHIDVVSMFVRLVGRFFA